MALDGDITSKIDGVALTDSKTDDIDDIVNPWTVESTSSKGVDYDKLISTYIRYFYFIFAL